MDFDMLLMIAATQGGGAVPIPTTPGPELWPQPGFDASTGLTLTRMTVTGSQAVADNSGLFARCAATAAGGTFAVGTWVQYSIDVIATNGSDSITITVAGNNIRVGVVTISGTKTVSGTAQLASAASQVMQFQVDNNDLGVVKFDNASIKVLT